MIKRFFKSIIEFVEILSIIAILFLALYFLTRIIIFSIAQYTLIERIVGILLLAAEGFITLHALSFLMSIIRLARREENKQTLKLIDFPSVAVVVAARHEPKEVLNKTFTTLKMLNYPNKNIYLLDDSTDEKFKKEAAEICHTHNATVFSRQERHGAKAGIVNDFIKQMHEKYLAIFDADQNPMPNFLLKTIPYFEENPKLAFVQTPQFYTNINVGPIAKGACMQQAIFYEFLCEAKSAANAMFCCGTNVVFKKSALNDVGNFDESSITEDFATSIRIHGKGYHSIYHRGVAAFGMAPESLPEYFKQQARWATGSIQVFKKIILSLIKNPFSMSFLQWWEYLISGSYYFIGIAFFILISCPILYLIFNIPSYFSLSQVYLSVFAPYFSLSLLIFYSAMATRKYKLVDLYHGTILGILSFPILIKSAIYGLLGKKVTFAVTSKGKSEKMSFCALWPYHLTIGLSFLAIAFGTIRIIHGEPPFALLLNMFWTAYHLFILLHIYYFNKTPSFKK